MLSRRSIAAAGAGLLLAPSVSRAQELPAGPVRFVVPFPPGGPADVLARLLTPRISTRLGRTIVVENRGGAGGLVGMEALGPMRPQDGIAFGIATMGSIVTSPMVSSVQGRFVPLRDLAPVTRVGTVPEMIVVNARTGIRTLSELLERARREPGKITSASSGVGGIAHLAIEMLRLVTGVELTHVPYRGVAPAMNDLLAGQVDMMIADVTAFAGFLDGGKLRALAVASPQRSSAMPSVPTTTEAGLPEYKVANWYALMAARATPEPVLAKLNEASVATLRDPEVISGLVRLGVEAAPTAPAEMADFLRAETDLWADVVRRTGAALE